MVSSSTSSSEHLSRLHEGLVPRAEGEDLRAFQPRDPTMWALIATLALVALIASIRWDPRLAVVRPLFFESKLAWAPGSSDVVLAGDSRVYRGLAPTEFASGSTVLNFGFSSVRLDETYLKRAASLLRPKGTLIIGLSALSFTHSKRDGFDEAVERAAKRSGSDRVRAMIDSVLRERLRPVALGLVLGSDDDRAEATEEEYIERFFDDGFVGSDYMVRQPTRALGPYRESLERGLTADPAMIDDMVRGIAALEARGTRVVCLRMPSSPEMMSLEDAYAGVDWERLARELESVGAEWLRFDVSGFESYDGSHLTEESARELSRRIRRALAASPES